MTDDVRKELETLGAEYLELIDSRVRLKRMMDELKESTDRIESKIHSIRKRGECGPVVIGGHLFRTEYRNGWDFVDRVTVVCGESTNEKGAARGNSGAPQHQGDQT